LLVRKLLIHPSKPLFFTIQLVLAFRRRIVPSRVRTPANSSTPRGVSKTGVTCFSGNCRVARLSARLSRAPASRFRTPATSLILFAALSGASPAHAQSFNVLHAFTGGADGASPGAGLTMDQAGNFFGTTEHGGPNGPNGYGIVFTLTPGGSGWILTPLYSFAGGDDGALPQARVIIGPDGSLYGTTTSGGGTGCGGNGCGTVFNLRPPLNASANALSGWTETVLYQFRGGNDGSVPLGDLVFDQSGHLYGTTSRGGSTQQGTVYKLTSSNGSWTESILHSFTGGLDGGQPAAGVIFNSAGQLFGTTQSGGAFGHGLVFQLASGQSGWLESAVYSFLNLTDGANPVGGLVFDSSGNLYGSTSSGGNGGGAIFELTPLLSGIWTMTVLYDFTGQAGGGPHASLMMDAAGHLYGTTYKDGADGYGSVPKLSLSNGSWVQTDLHNFTFGSDGAEPVASLSLDTSGNLYGTALAAGEYGYGVVFQISPLQITTTSLPAGTVNSPYSATLSVSGGVPPYSWSVIGGSLPSGLTLSTSGVISGTPTAAGTFSFTVQVRDSESPPATAIAPLSITIRSSLTITTTSLPLGTVDIPYSATLAATGGLPPYTWSVVRGTLPSGLTLNGGSGLISGSPTAAGTFNFTVQVSDSQSPPAIATAPLSITVSAQSVFLAWNPSSSPGVIGYNAYRGTASGGPYTRINSTLITPTNYSDQTVQGGHTYYYVTTAVNNLGEESAYSNQAVVTVP
jgi:uncharacterized repeat protein (TIGR03803 family)